MNDDKFRGANPSLVIVDELASAYPSLPQKRTYNCPADSKLIPFLIDGICRHWYLFTGGNDA